MAARKDAPDDRYSDAETQARFKSALRTMLHTRPKPHADMKIGKPKAGKTKSSKPRR